MAVTLTGIAGGGDVWGRHRVDLRQITGDASYPAGGYAISGPQVGLRSIVGMTYLGGNTAAAGIVPFWNNATGKLQFLYPTETGTSPNVAGDAPPGTNFSTVTFTMLIVSLDD